MAEKGRRDGGTAFGQVQPPLYIYIKRILERYPGGQIFKVVGELAGDSGSNISCKLVLFKYTGRVTMKHKT